MSRAKEMFSQQMLFSKLLCQQPEQFANEISKAFTPIETVLYVQSYVTRHTGLFSVSVHRRGYMEQGKTHS
jgi:hypothetical protein